MKFRLMIVAMMALTPALWAGEALLTITHQPLDGLGSGEITISAVTCYDWYALSGQATAIGLISARNVPPTNNLGKGIDDLNLASISGVRFEASDLGDPEAPLGLTMDTTLFAVPEGLGYERDQIIRASLECLRLCLPEKLRQTPVVLKTSPENEKWMADIVREFNAHDRSKVFWTVPE